jgi:hypothetical protein
MIFAAIARPGISEFGAWGGGRRGNPAASLFDSGAGLAMAARVDTPACQKTAVRPSIEDGESPRNLFPRLDRPEHSASARCAARAQMIAHADALKRAELLDLCMTCWRQAQLLRRWPGIAGRA